MSMYIIIVATVAWIAFWVLAIWRPGYVLFALGIIGLGLIPFSHPYSRTELIGMWGDKLGSQLAWGLPMLIAIFALFTLAGAGWILTDGGKLPSPSHK